MFCVENQVQSAVFRSHNLSSSSGERINEVSTQVRPIGKVRLNLWIYEILFDVLSVVFPRITEHIQTVSDCQLDNVICYANFKSMSVMVRFMY
jgi:hypothetical protein